VDPAESGQLAQDEILEEEEEDLQRPVDPADDWTDSEDMNLGMEPSDDGVRSVYIHLFQTT
jgi:hypothetical protein